MKANLLFLNKMLNSTKPKISSVNETKSNNLSRKRQMMSTRSAAERAERKQFKVMAFPSTIIEPKTPFSRKIPTHKKDKEKVYVSIE